MAELTVEELREELASIKSATEGIPLILRAIEVLQRDMRRTRDDMTVLTGIVIRLEGGMTGLVEEMRGLRDKAGHLDARVGKLEAVKE